MERDEIGNFFNGYKTIFCNVEPFSVQGRAYTLSWGFVDRFKGTGPPNENSPKMANFLALLFFMNINYKYLCSICT